MMSLRAEQSNLLFGEMAHLHLAQLQVLSLALLATTYSPYVQSIP